MRRCEVRLPYASSATLEAAFPEFALVQIAPAETLLIGTLRDGSELHTLLARIADLGLEITELRQEQCPASEGGGPASPKRCAPSSPRSDLESELKNGRRAEL